MPRFNVFERTYFPLFTEFLGENFETFPPNEFSSSFFYSGPYEGSNTVEIEGDGLVADADGTLIAGQVTGIRWNSYEYTGFSSIPYFTIQESGIFDLDLPATQVAQALEDSWTLDGPDQFAGVAAFFEGQVLLMDYFFTYSGITIEDAVYDNLLPGQLVRVNASPHADTLVAFEAGTVIMANGGDDLVTGVAGDDVVHGGNGDDTLAGGAGNDTLFGGAGADRLLGQTGDDRMIGDAGDDHMDGAIGRDDLYGDAGNDTLLGGVGDDLLDGGSGGDDLDGGTGADVLYGDTGFDTLMGGADDDQLNGGDQADNLWGQAGQDYLNGDAGFDRLFGGAGDDTLRGGNQGDALFGQAGNDVLGGDYGAGSQFNPNAGDDRLFGGAGFDTLVGDGGNDLLSGNFNADTFVFFNGFGQDTITDFDALNPFERIDLSALSTITDIDDLQLNHLQQVGADAVIDALDGNTITLLGVNIADLDTTDFIF